MDWKKQWTKKHDLILPTDPLVKRYKIKTPNGEAVVDEKTFLKLKELEEDVKRNKADQEQNKDAESVDDKSDDVVVQSNDV